MHSPTQSPMTARCVAAATAVLTIVALGCIFALSVLSAEDDNDQRLRPLSSRRNFRGTKTIDQVRQSRPVAFMRNIVHRRGLSENKDSDIPANYGNKQGHQEPPLSLALVRPISVRDAEALVNSFVHWDEFVPGADKGCRFSKDNQSSSIDIIISFSREFDKQKYPDITAAMEAVHSLFEKTNGWGGCIQSIKTFEANICPEEDLYDPLLAEQGNRMWANGPNRQFERTFRYAQSLDKYDAMFLMESDTYPAADGWLDLLVEEVKSRAPFALLGSKYNGHAWDDFADQMPLALLHHINGNAIYNTTHPLLELVVSELEDEADTWYNAITYDYRISQILLEGSTGAPPYFPFANVVDEVGNRMKLLPKTEKFSRWWKECSDTHKLVQESDIMTNLGSTAFLPGDVEDGIAIVHGKNMYLPWNSSIHGNVSLVVSDWGEMDEPYKEFLSKLNAIDHPYSEIILVADLESDEFIHKVWDWCDSTLDLPVVIQNRTHDGASDLCNAEPTSDYFMLTDVGQAPRGEIELLVASDGSNRPVVPFVSSESVHCSSYKSCDTVIQEARHFYDSMDRFIFSDEMLFRKDFLQDYCRELRDHANPTIISKGNNDNGIMGPTATGYIAFLRGIEVVNAHYAFSNIVIEGSRRNFVPADPRIPIGLKYHVASVIDRSAANSEVPVLWHIPKSGGTTMLTLLSWCLHQTVASSSGVVLERQRGKLGIDDFPRHLYTIKDGVARFVSVDVSSSKGIIRARDLDLIGSGIADAIVTPLLSKAVLDIFSSEAGRRARVFSIFRHPVERAASLFYYLQSATWEPTYDPSLQNMTIEEYAKSAKAESNWMVRMLNDEPAVVDERHLDIAKRILQEKVLIGLTSQMEESVRRFYAYFGWGGSGGEWNQCERRLLFGGANTNDQHSLEEGAMAWDLLSSRNSLDVALYDYAVELFHRQGTKLFGSNSFSPVDSLAPGMTRNSDVEDGEIHQLLDVNVGRRIESNVADGDIVSFRAPSLALSCSDITNSDTCAGRQSCVWKESSKICESNIFGHSAEVAYKSNAKNKCVNLQSERNMLRCFKKTKRRCRAIKNRHRKSRCLKNQRRWLAQAKKKFRPRRLHVNIPHRPRMYTFYTRVETQASAGTDRALLGLWKEEWTRAGFDARIMTLDDAKKHPSFPFYQRMLEQNTTLYEPLEYNRMCFYRWLAMATVGGGYMSDNDVLPLQGSYNLAEKKELPNDGKFTVYELHVPSLLVGSAEEWNRLAFKILDVATAQSKGEIEISNGSGMTSDMLALLPVVESQRDVIIHPHHVVWNPHDFSAMNQSACGVLSHRPAVHFSHRVIYAIGSAHIDDRPAIMRKWIGRWRELCISSDTFNEEDRRFTLDEEGTILNRALEADDETAYGQYESTIVIPYFSLKNAKHTSDNYFEWAEYAMCIEDPLVIFTNTEHVDMFKRLRAHAENKTLIVPMELEDIDFHGGNKFWGKLATTIGTNNIYNQKMDFDIFKLWLGKSWFVNEALKLNPFKSSKYVYMDLGHLRIGPVFCGKSVVRHPESIPNNRVVLYPWRALNAELKDHERDADPVFSGGFNLHYIAGGMMSGGKNAWPTFLEKIEESINIYDERGERLDDDQAVMQSTCMRNPGLCYITRWDSPFGSGNGNCEGYSTLQSCVENGGWTLSSTSFSGFFYMAFRLYHGGDIKSMYWDPGTGTPTPEEDPGLYVSAEESDDAAPSTSVSIFYNGTEVFASELTGNSQDQGSKDSTAPIATKMLATSELFPASGARFPIKSDSKSDLDALKTSSAGEEIQQERINTMSPSNYISLVPKLSFTNSSMFWEDIHGHDSPSISLMLRGKRPLSWKPPSTDGNFPESFRTREDISFRISRYRNKDGLPPACDSGRSGGVLVWIESINNDVVLSAPALCVHSGDDLLARAQIQDPGMYRIHVVGYDLSILEAGAHGTVATILPVRNSPWYFLVKPDAVAIPSPTSAPLVFNLPSRFCEFSDLEVSGEGRWIKCVAAGIPPSRCLSDGWIYVPHECRHRITPTVDALEQAKEIVDKRGGKPLWIVFTGTSVDRGTFHALVDHIAAIGMMEDGTIKRSVADAIFRDVKDKRGQGSTTKCWGWIDIQVGSLRLSYQDARLHMMRDDQHWIKKTNDRWNELFSEGPDLVVVGLEGHSNTPEDLRAYGLATSQIVEATAATNFTGLVAINPTKKRILNGGIKNAYECSSGGIRSSIENVRISLLKAFSRCEICRYLDKSRFVVSDELLMGWSFLFNMERPMSDEMASQHFHRYVSEALPRPTFGSDHTNRRYVIGAVTEMAAQIYLGTVLSGLSKDLGISLQHESSRDQSTTTEDWEVSFAETQPFRACFTCPYSALPWKPPTSPSATLSHKALANTMENFDASRFIFATSASRGEENRSLAFCYE